MCDSSTITEVVPIDSEHPGLTLAMYVETDGKGVAAAAAARAGVPDAVLAAIRPLPQPAL